jgi:hypothetical protein
MKNKTKRKARERGREGKERKKEKGASRSKGRRDRTAFILASTEQQYILHTPGLSRSCLASGVSRKKRHREK